MKRLSFRMILSIVVLSALHMVGMAANPSALAHATQGAVHPKSAGPIAGRGAAGGACGPTASGSNVTAFDPVAGHPLLAPAQLNAAGQLVGGYHVSKLWLSE